MVITRSAPAASATRRIVPALPGSCTRDSTAINFGFNAPSPQSSEKEASTIKETAIIPCGDTESAIAASTSSVTTRMKTRRPSSGVGVPYTCSSSSAISSWRSNAASVTYTASRMGLFRCAFRASRTACGPSTRNWPFFVRAERVRSFAISRTRSACGLDITTGVLIRSKKFTLKGYRQRHTQKRRTVTTPGTQKAAAHTQKCRRPLTTLKHPTPNLDLRGKNTT